MPPVSLVSLSLVTLAQVTNPEFGHPGSGENPWFSAPGDPGLCLEAMLFIPSGVGNRSQGCLTLHAGCPTRGGSRH